MACTRSCTCVSIVNRDAMAEQLKDEWSKLSEEYAQLDDLHKQYKIKVLDRCLPELTMSIRGEQCRLEKPEVPTIYISYICRSTR